MFERFTRDARGVVVAAQEVARTEDDLRVDVRHLWMALCDSALSETLAEAGLTRDTLAPTDAGTVSDAEALRSVGIDLESVREAAEANFGEGALDREVEGRRSWFRRARGGAGRHLPFSGEAKKTLELSLREALRLDSGVIGLEHLALGALRVAPSVVGDADVAALRARLEERLRRTA